MAAIKKNHGHWQLTSRLKDLLLQCRAEDDSSKYALMGIFVTENTLAATDGMRLVEVQCQHKIPSATYYVSEDGYLLKTTEIPFPKYEKIIPDKGESRQIVKVNGSAEDVSIIGLILGELCHAKCVIDLYPYRRPAEILSSIINGEVSVFVDKEKPAERPFLIEAETSVGHIRYVQMPISVKNEL